MQRTYWLMALVLLLAGCPGSADLKPDRGAAIDLLITIIKDGGAKDGAKDGPSTSDGPQGDAPRPEAGGDGPSLDDAQGDSAPPADSTVDSAPCGGGCPAGLDCVNNSCQCIVGGSCNGCCLNNTCITLNLQSTTRCGQNGATCATCPADRTDRCTGGVCRCGTNSACGAGLNCTSAQCNCIENGRCNGCCADATTCVTNPSTSQCGADGAACAACDADTANNCSTSGECRCGGSAACGAGLNCVGGTCQCIENGRCAGCCENNTCYDPVTVTHCGENGSACFSCPVLRSSHCFAQYGGQCSCHDGFGPPHPPCATDEICVPSASFYICEPAR